MEKAPSAPTYTQPAGYASPGSFQPAGYTGVTSGVGVGKQANRIMDTAPSWLNLSQYDGSSPGQLGGPFNPQLMQKTQNWYMQNEVDPAVSQAVSNSQNAGQNYGSYGAAYAGQLAGEGQQQAFQAALAANQQQYNDVIQGNQAYYQGPAALAAQQDNLQSNLDQAVNLQNSANANQFALSSAGMQNQYDLGAAGMENNFNLQNYGNEFEANQYNNQLLGSELGMGLGLGGSILGGLF